MSAAQVRQPVPRDKRVRTRVGYNRCSWTIRNERPDCPKLDKGRPGTILLSRAAVAAAIVLGATTITYAIGVVATDSFAGDGMIPRAIIGGIAILLYAILWLAVAVSLNAAGRSAAEKRPQPGRALVIVRHSNSVCYGPNRDEDSSRSRAFGSQESDAQCSRGNQSTKQAATHRRIPGPAPRPKSNRIVGFGAPLFRRNSSTRRVAKANRHRPAAMGRQPGQLTGIGESSGGSLAVRLSDGFPNRTGGHEQSKVHRFRTKTENTRNHMNASSSPCCWRSRTQF